MRPTRRAPFPRTPLCALFTGGLIVSVLAVPALGAPTPQPQPWKVTDHRNNVITGSAEPVAPGVPSLKNPVAPSLKNPVAPSLKNPVAPSLKRPVASPTRRDAAPSAPKTARRAGPRTTKAVPARRQAGSQNRATVRPATVRPTTTRPATTRPATTPSTSPSPSTGTNWHSGATGPGSVDGVLSALRGRDLQIVGVFGDTTAEIQASLPALVTLKNFDGDIDVAFGGLTDDTPESWAQASQGAYRTRWTLAARALRAARDGKPGAVYVRFAHEANGDWFPWKVDARTVNDFHRSWQLFHDVLATEFPRAKLVFCANTGSRSDIGIEQLWPGDDLVDVVAVDIHAGWEAVDAASWRAQLDDVTNDGSPRGLGAWLTFAKRHGKPFAVSRWGLDPGGATGDDGMRVRLMHDFLSSNAAAARQNPAGRVIYDIFFNYETGEDTRSQITDPRNAISAAAYRALRWGSP